MSMVWWIGISIAVYCIGFVGTFWVCITNFPFTAGLALLCSAFWPVWWATGFRWPAGEPLRMD